MSLSFPAPARSVPIHRIQSARAAWILVALLMGIGVGLAVALSQTTAALAIILLPLVGALLLRPEWLPSVLMATIFGEAVATGSVTLSRIGGPLAILVMIVALPQRTRVRLPRVGVLIAAIGYAAWAFASVLWTVNPDGSFAQGGTGYALASLALSLVYTVAMIMFVRSEQDLRRLMWVTWALSSITGLVSVIQYLSGYTRALGLSGDANLFAALQVVVLPLGALLAIQVRTARLRALVLLGVSVSVGSIMTSLSRGGILALVAVFLMLSYQPAKGFFRSRARKRAFIAFVAVGAGVLLAASFSALSARASSLFVQNDGGSGRTNLWQAAITGWHEHEVQGLGFGAFIGQSNALLLETPGVSFNDYRLRTTGQVVHNAYLESLVELGVIGAALFLTLLVAVARSIRATQRDASVADRWFVSAFCRALLLSLVGFAFTSFFLSTETDRTLWTLVGLSVALPRVLAEERRQAEPALEPTEDLRHTHPNEFSTTPGVAI